MPALGESVTEGTITRWLKSVGDAVEVDEPLLEVSTDKVDTEIPSPVAGVLQEILAEEDDTVEVGADLCVVGDDEASDGDSGGSSDADADDSSGQDEQEEDPSTDDGSSDDDEQQQDTSDEESSGGGSADSGSSGGSSSGGGGSSGGETVTMPALGESVTEGTVTRWLKSEGDSVEVDEPLLEVSTDKVDTEIPSPVAGVLTSILAAEDETVEVGGDLAVIGGESSGDSGGSQDQQDDSSEQDAQPEPEQDSGGGSADEKDEDGSGDAQEGGSSDDDLAEESDKHEQAAEESAEKSGTSEADDSGVATGVGTTSTENGTSSHKDADGDGTPDAQQKTGSGEAPSQDVSAYVTPLVRKLAAQHGVDLASLSGTGVGGRVRKQDVLDAAEAKKKESEQPPAEQAPAEQPAEKSAPSGGGGAPGAGEAKRGTTEKMSRLRKVIATRMVESLQTSAQLTTVVEVDVTKISRLRKRAKDEFLKREGTKLSFMPFFAMAAIEALKEHPIVNASVEDDSIVYHASEHLGIAVDTPRGLLVPVIKDAGDLNIAGLARKIADLAERTRDNKVGPDELSGGTFTLTNTGSRGALFDTPIINQPNVGILGTGAVVKRPVVVVDEDGMETIAIRDMVYLAISYDHRVVDGADAARFLATMKERLQDGKFEV